MKKPVLFILMLLSTSFVQATTTIDIPPVIAITNPDNQSTFTAGSDITITATASETDGAISSVSFYNGSTLLGQSSKSPYSYTWDNVLVGVYTLTAVATDTDKVSTASSVVTVKVTPAPPVIDITSPANDTTFTAGSNISLAATASEGNGTISTVSFYNGSTLLTTSSAASSSYNYTWDNVPAGTYTLTAVATGADKLSTTSSPIAVTVTSSSVPVVAITRPAKGSTYIAGSNITITASASENNGTIREIYFFDGTYYIGSSSVSPYTYTWDNVPAGAYSLTAEATDSNGGTFISAPINITVNPNCALTPTACG